ncbi:hypothetical protein AVEN_30282-1 [Araneus ventricosus]|uniref:Ig-like domain-containing protein n=1 Tax=Araneus ventricosus TaxID=182803 RepID=A0A4Y2HHU1_ARAVE|nr:hypothetical protein AVEN_30282-1 [Araneus ventricosus]
MRCPSKKILSQLVQMSQVLTEMAAPPCFLQVLPTETDATDGDIVTFQVKVSSDPNDPTVVSWWRCGESLRPVPGHREMIEHEDGWHELILSNVTEDDEGEYECRAENHRGHNSCFGSLFYYQEGERFLFSALQVT